MATSTYTVPKELGDAIREFNGADRGLRITEITGTHKSSGESLLLWDYWEGWNYRRDPDEFEDLVIHYDALPMEVDGIRYLERPNLVGAPTFYNFRHTNGGMSFVMRHKCSVCKRDWVMNDNAFIRTGRVECNYCHSTGGRIRYN